MTREQFVKYSFRAYMTLSYHHPRHNEPIECMLIEVDFDNEMFLLAPLDPECGVPNSHYNTFYTTIKFVELAPKKLKIIK